MSGVAQREIPATPDLRQNSGSDQEFCTPGDFAKRMTELNIEMTERQAIRLFAEHKFPRFFVGKRSYVKFSAGLDFITKRKARG